MSAELAMAAPLVLPLNPECNVAEGYIDLGASQPSSLWVRVTGIPQAGSPMLAGARLEVGAELAALLAGHEELIAARLRESPTLSAFFVELQNVLAQLASARPDAAAATIARPAAFYSTLWAELDALGWDKVSHLADDLSSVSLDVHDAAGRSHPLVLSLPAGFPAAAPSAAADVPAAFAPRWGPGSSLRDVLAHFEAALQQYQWLWDSLDDLDALAWVIEPARPQRSVAYRRLALGDHVTLAVTLDPLQPGSHPECRFMGAERSVQPLLSRLHAHRALWRPEALLRHNLEAVLGMSLPGKQAADGGAAAEDVSVACAICYAFRLPAERGPELEAAAGLGAGGEEAAGEPPDVNCDNAACGKPFHRRCLAEWLAADTTTRQSFGTLFGACPYCSAPITVKAT